MDEDYKRINEEFYSKKKWSVDRNPKKYLLNNIKLHFLRKFMCIKDGDTVLDVGGGAGNWSWALLQDGKGDFTVLDISEQALAMINDNRIKKVRGDIMKLPKKEYDKVMAVDVMEHLTEIDAIAALEGLSSVCKTGGTIVIDTSCDGWYLGKGKRIKEIDRRDGHLSRIKFQEWTNMFLFFGLEIEDKVFVGHFFERIARWMFEVSLRLYSIFRGESPQSLKSDTKWSGRMNPIFEKYLNALTYITWLDVWLFGKIEGRAFIVKLRKKE